MHIAFYKGSGLVGLAVRIDSRRPGQAFADVPAHVSLVIGETLFEMVSGGWHSRPALASDLAWSVELTGLDEGKALAAVLLWRGTRYGWWVDALIGLSRFIPDRWLSTTRGSQKYICSAFVKYVLQAPAGNARTGLQSSTSLSRLMICGGR